MIEHKHSNLLLKYPIKKVVLTFIVFTLQIKYEKAETTTIGLNLEICTVKLNVNIDIEIYFETRIRAESFKMVDQDQCLISWFY